MKIFVFAYLGGLLASIPAYGMFNDVGASPFRNLDAVKALRGDSLMEIIIYFALLWVVPAFGSTVGAKLAGHPWDFQHCYRRGIGGQVVFSIGLGVLMLTVPAVAGFMASLSTPMQTAAFLMFAQIGCTLGTVWGY
jgi:hypothetical protein